MLIYVHEIRHKIFLKRYPRNLTVVVARRGTGRMGPEVRERSFLIMYALLKFFPLYIYCFFPNKNGIY